MDDVRDGVDEVRSWRWRRIVVAVTMVLSLAVVGALGGIAWYFSNLAVRVDHTTERPATAWPGPDGTVILTKDHESQLPGRYGLEWEGGYGTVTSVTATSSGDSPAEVSSAGGSSSEATSSEANSSEANSSGAAGAGSAAVTTAAGTVTRRFEPGTGRLAAGTKVLLDSFAYRGDPRTALGLDYETVSVPSPLGAMPAWYVPATGDPAADRGRSWVVFVHGHDSNRQESLRYLTALHRLRLPVLVVSYRNDIGAPAAPDGVDHLGDTEWQDVAAALTWVKQAGARDVVLAGWSMGGAVSLQTWDRSGLRGFVRGLVLDSPVIDWRDVLTFQGSQRGLPSQVTALAVQTVRLRFGVDFDRLDWVTRNRELTAPLLVFASDDDTYVPDGPAKRLAAARPDLVTLVNVPGADHTRSWNVDPGAYETQLSRWLVAQGATTP